MPWTAACQASPPHHAYEAAGWAITHIGTGFRLAWFPDADPERALGCWPPRLYLVNERPVRLSWAGETHSYATG